MYDNNKRITLGKTENSIACLGDAHIGHPNFHEKTFKKADKKIWESGQSLITMGDMIECREPSHPFFVPGSITINDQLNICFDMLQKYADEKRLKGLLIGNHEAGLIRKTSSNEMERWCKQNDVNYLDYAGVLDFEVDKHDYSVIFHHGAGSGTTIGASANKLSNFTRYFSNYDACIMAHTHQLAILPPTVTLYRDKKKQKTIDKYCFPAYTGSFFLTYMTGPAEYGERKGYAPLPLGYIVMTLEDGLAQCRPEIFKIN